MVTSLASVIVDVNVIGEPGGHDTEKSMVSPGAAAATTA